MQQLVVEPHSPLREQSRLYPSIDRLPVTEGTDSIGAAVVAVLAATSGADSLVQGKERIAKSMQRFLPERSIHHTRHPRRSVLLILAIS
jgi:hypothetical protein